MVSDTANTTRMTGAEAIVASLEALGVTDVFGMPGGAILPTYDPLLASTSIRHILVRHEQGAGHAAEGYALATGKVGCAIVTSGPGATNVLTALGDACMDSVPIVVISGQVGASLIGSDAFQEADIVGASMPITKHSFLVTDPAEIPARLAEAFHLAGTGRPGPVLVDITKSAQVAEMDFSWPPAIDLPGYRVADKPNMKQVRAAARAIADAQAPVLYVGGGIVRSGSTDALAELVEVTNAPVVTTLTARGAFPDSDRHNLGMPGMHGTVAAVGALQRADLIVALGARFDDRVTGRLDSFAPRATVVHIDIDAAEISKNRHADIPIKVALINNSVLGMVRQWQSLFFGKSYSNTTLNPVEGEQIPNFEMLAQAYGMAARTVRSIDEVDEAIEWAMSINDRPVLIDFRVSKDSMVWPMVAAGVSNDEIRYAKGMAPDWEVED